MSVRIEEFICSNCDLELKALSIISYTCPNCGGILLPKESKFKMELENAITSVKDEDKKINEALKKLYLVKKVLNNKQFVGVKDIIENMICIIKDPTAATKIKVIVAVALLYIITPIDLVPDVIPGVGLADDIVIVLLAANMVASLDDSYQILKIKLRQQANLNTLVYSVINAIEHPIYNYTEESKKRIWVLNIDEVKKYNLSLIDNSLIKAPEQYIGHSYLQKTLIPMSNADAQLLNHNLEEMRNISRMLGAKTIRFTIRDDMKAEKKAVAQINIPGKADADVSGKQGHDKNETQTFFDEYKKFNEINLNYINNFLWYFTNETPFKSIIEERLYNNVKRKQFKYHLETTEYFSADMRANIVKKNKLGLNLKLSKSIKKFIEIDIEFFDLPKDIEEHKEEIYKDIQLALDKRKNEIDGVVWQHFFVQKL